MTRILALLLILSGWAFYSPPSVQAACEVQSGTVTYSDGAFIGGDLCDVYGNKKTAIGGSSSGGFGTNEAANPSRVEQSAGSFSFDLSGNARVTQGTLIEGEDQTNHLLQTSGGVVRLTTFSSVTSATTSSVTTVPIGVKTFMAYMGGASETKAFDLTIYGNWQNSTTGGRVVCRIYVPSTASITHIESRCPDVEQNFTYWYYTADVYTSASSASLIVYAMY